MLKPLTMWITVNWKILKEMEIPGHLTCLLRKVRYDGLVLPSLYGFSTVYWDPQSQSLSVVNEAEVDIFLEFPCLFYDSVNVGNLISGSSAFSKPSLYIWKFLVYVLLKPALKDFENYLASMWNECSCLVVWIFFGIVFLWDWNENWPFPDLWPLLSFPNLLAYQVQHFHSKTAQLQKRH